MAKSWASGGALSTGRWLPAGSGTSSAGLISGGTNSSNVSIDTCEEYSGGSYSSGGTMPAVNSGHLGSAGTQTAGLVAGGNSIFGNAPSTATYLYDGSSWSTGNAVGTTGLSGIAGTQSAATIAYGYNGGDLNGAQTYNGSTWSAITNATTQRAATACGTASAYMSMGGTGGTTTTRTWNGTSWGTGGTCMSGNAMTSAGVNNAAVLTCNAVDGQTDEYDGSAWSNTSTNRPVTNESTGGYGSMSSMVTSGGGNYTTATYVWTDAPSSAIKTINGLADASVKTINSLARASVKTWNGLA